MVEEFREPDAAADPTFQYLTGQLNPRQPVLLAELQRRSAEAVIERMGVIPEPAAISTCRPGTARSGVNEPAGGCTSMRSPGLTSRTSQPETAPPGTSRTPIRGGWPAAEQME